MRIVETYTEIAKYTGAKTVIVSHGIDIDTDRIVILPQLTPQEIGGILRSANWTVCAT